MKTTRFLAVPALAAASLLALTGCIQLPPVGGSNGGSNGGSSDGGTTGEGTDLTGTTWTGSMEDFARFTIELADDGTIDFSMWNDEPANFDAAGDVWEGDSANLSLTITDLRDQNGDGDPFSVTFTGTAEDGQMQLEGDAPDGTWELTATQE